MCDTVIRKINQANTDSERLSILTQNKSIMQNNTSSPYLMSILNSFDSDIHRVDALPCLNTSSISIESILSSFDEDDYRYQALSKLKNRSNESIHVDKINGVSILEQFDLDVYRVQALKILRLKTCDTIQILNVFDTDTFRVSALSYLNTDINQIDILKQFDSDADKVNALKRFANITTTVHNILNTFDSDTYRLSALSYLKYYVDDSIQILSCFNEDSCKINVLNTLSDQNIKKSPILSMVSQFSSDSSKKIAFDKIKHLYQIQYVMLDILKLFKKDSVKIKLCDENICNMLTCNSSIMLSNFRKTSSKKKVAEIFNIPDTIYYCSKLSDSDSSDSDSESEFEYGNTIFTNSSSWTHRSSKNSKVIIDGVDIGKVVKEKSKLEKENKKLKRKVKKKEKKEKITMSIPECLDNETDNESIQCAVCLMNENKIVLNCGHQYCRSCISDHLEKNKDCPDCRQEVTAAIRIFNRH